MPRGVREYAAGRPLRLVWRNEIGGLTYEVGTAPERCFVKWTPAASEVDLAEEITRLAWAGRFTPVPRVLDQGDDGRGSWFATAALPGQSAIADRWKASPAQAVTAIGRGLRALHDAPPVQDCPFSWSAPDRLDRARARTHAGLVQPRRWHSEHRSIGVSRALALLADIPPVDQLVVCHGDACAPNTLLTEDGHWSGHVDLGSLGVADRWADLATATWSTVWNYGPGWQDVLLHAYGGTADPVRTRFYRLLWEFDP